MTDFTGLYFSEDIVFKETSSFDQAVFESGTVFYEVIRITDGTALFLEDHLQRLQNSITLDGYSFTVSIPLIHYLLRNLIKRNNTANGNVRIMIHFKQEALPMVYTFFVPHFYPAHIMYEKGVSVALYNAERTDPNIKKMHPDLIRSINTFIKSRDIYDVLLVDKQETVTEGSRTNVFFISGDKLITPPENKILKGVTRTKIFLICNQLGINLIEQNIPTNALSKFEGAFFSGTSPKVLPISHIDKIGFNVEIPLLRTLMKAYDQLIADYIGNI